MEYIVVLNSLNCLIKTIRRNEEQTNQAVPDDMKDEAVEKAADGGKKTEWERLLLFIHLNFIQDSEAHRTDLLTKNNNTLFCQLSYQNDEQNNLAELIT